MDWLELFFGGEPATTRDVRSMGEKIRGQIRRTASLQSETFEQLVQENRELRLYLTALLQLLFEKDLLKPAEVQAKMLSLLPPLPAAKPEDENPFAGLGR